MKKISQSVKNMVIDKLKDGVPVGTITRETGVSRRTIFRIKSENKTTMPQTKTGRPQKLTPRMERHFARLAASGHYTTSTEIALAMKEKHGIDVSRTTVARSMAKNGLLAHSKVVKPMISEVHAKARLAFARK